MFKNINKDIKHFIRDMCQVIQCACVFSHGNSQGRRSELCVVQWSLPLSLLSVRDNENTVLNKNMQSCCPLNRV